MFQPPGQPRLPNAGIGDRLKGLRRKIDGQVASHTTQGPRAPVVQQGHTGQGVARAPVVQQGQAATGAQNQPPAPVDPDKQREDFIASMMGGVDNVDTSQEEALIRELMLDNQQKELVGNRARMGRSGFAESGATAAIEGDVMRKAGQSTTGQILDTRNDATQRAIDNAFRGIDADNEQQRITADIALQQAILGIDDAPYVPPKQFDNNNNGVADSVEDARDSYPDGPEAWQEAQATGHTESARYSQAHGGDYSGLPQREPTEDDVLANTTNEGVAIYYNPTTKELFRGAA